MHSIDKDGGPTWRATSSSGGTQPRRIVGGRIAAFNSISGAADINCQSLPGSRSGSSWK